MTTIEAMKQADYVLASVLAVSPDSITTARTALQDAIKREEAQTVEPVAWMNAKRDMTYLSNYNLGDIPLFTHPAPPPSGERDALHAEFEEEGRLHGMDMMRVLALNSAAKMALESLEAMTRYCSIVRLGESRLKDTETRGDAHVAIKALQEALK